MRWQVKAAVQKGFDLLPEAPAERLNYMLQRRVTRTLPIGEDELFVHFEQALGHVRNFTRFAGPAAAPLSGVSAFEFGAGWDLAGPLSLYALGAESQVIVDIRPLIRWELVNHVITLLAAHRAELERRAGRPLRALDGGRLNSVEDLERRFGIVYRAPVDVRRTGLPGTSFGLITNTFTLEHIPRAELADILRECARLLGPGGVLSCSIDMQDHYAYSDERVSVYNFLRYSDRVWRLINSRLHHQNRLRAPDYLDLITQAGLRVASAEAETADRSQRHELDRLPVDPQLAARYSSEELAAATMLVAAVAQ